ncbi:trypsin-like serine protease [Streptomyces vietnamensis]
MALTSSLAVATEKCIRAPISPFGRPCPMYPSTSRSRGGSLIAPVVVLTAAHCAVDAMVGKPEATVGRTVLSDRRQGRVRKVTECDKAVHICASRENRDSCQGDSGGPLFGNGNGNARC